jgi:transcriptional regulator with XRE-family HTH domain
MLSINSVLSNWLKEKRRSKNLQVKELAQQSGLNGAQISRVENGLTALTIPMLEQICYGLELTLYDLGDYFTDFEPIQKIWERKNQQSYNDNLGDGLHLVDVMAFVDFWLAETEVAREKLVEWLGVGIINKSGLKNVTAYDQAASWIAQAVRDSKGDGKIPYPPNIGLNVLRPIIRSRNVMLFDDSAEFTKLLRRENHFLLDDLALHSKISRSALNRIELGQVERVKVDEIVRLDQALNAKGEIVAAFWSVAETYSELYRGRSFRVRNWGQYEFFISDTFIRACRWLGEGPSTPGDENWLPRLRKELNLYYASPISKAMKRFNSTYDPSDLANDLLRVFSPYFNELSRELAFEKLEPGYKAFLPEPLRRIWNMMLGIRGGDVVYKTVLGDFLRNPANSDLQGAFRYYVAGGLNREMNILDIKNLLDQWENLESK